jgi:hypothetical protein
VGSERGERGNPVPSSPAPPINSCTNLQKKICAKIPILSFSHPGLPTVLDFALKSRVGALDQFGPFRAHSSLEPTASRMTKYEQV